MARFIPPFNIRGKLARDSLYNLFSLVLLGLSGLLINMVIARRYGPEVLGGFNLVMAVYVVFAQVGSLGIQASALKYVAQYGSEEEQGVLIVTSGLALALSLGLLSAGLLISVRRLLAELMGGPYLVAGLTLAAPALGCFILNKFLLAVLNGLRLMKAFAFFSALRSVFLIAGLLLVIAFRLKGTFLPAILTFSEGLLLVALIGYELKSVLTLGWGPKAPLWIKRHLAFGFKSLLGGLMIELNTRIDILMLGYLVSDYALGIYSFASILIEGIQQLPFVLRRNLDPVITRLSTGGGLDELEKTIKNFRWWTLGGMFLVAGISMAVYPLIVRFLVGDMGFMAGRLCFTVLLIGVAIQAAYSPFYGTLVQSGHPGLQTIFLAAITLINILLNAIFIPLWGIFGAALATAASLSCSVVVFRHMVRRALGIRV